MSRKNATVCVGVSFALLGTWLLNVTAYPAFDGVFPAARDVATVFGAAAALALAFCSMRWHRGWGDFRLTAAAAALLVVATGLMFLGANLNSPWMVTVGACLRSLASFAVTLYLGLALVALESGLRMPVIVAAFLLKYAWMGALWFVPYAGKVAALFIVPVAALFVLRRAAGPVLGAVAACSSPADLKVTNPVSFLPFTHRLFFAILMFQAGFGFAVTYGSTDSYPLPFIYSAVVVVAVGILMFVRPRTTVDALYGIAYVLALAGLLLVFGTSDSTAYAAPATAMLLRGASDVFGIAVWFLMACLCERNLAGAVPLVFVRSVATGLGTEVGALTGHAVNYVAVARPELTAVMIGAVVLVFASYNFFLARRFSFDRTVEELEPVVDTGSGIAAPVSAVDASCARLVAERGLTEREAQVFVLLARGRNAAFIQQELVITRNTVKSYVASVYRKLDVHSHQQLIDLVEKTADGLEHPIKREEPTHGLQSR